MTTDEQESTSSRVDDRRWPPQAGDLLCGGRFRVDALLDGGVLGIAYRATDLVADEIVVCKVPRCPPSATASDRGFLLDQYRKLRQVVSTDVVRPLGFYDHEWDDEPIPVLAMELIDGPPIRDVVGLSVYERLELLERTARALVLMHKEELRHGDLHVGNILVSKNRVVIIDPDSQRWGGSSRHPSGPSFSRESGVHPATDDLASFGQVIADVMGVDGALTNWLTEKLLGSTGSRPNLSEVADTLRSIRFSAPAFSPKDLGVLSQLSARDADTRHDLYRQLRDQRHDFLSALFVEVQAAAHAARFVTEVAQGDLARELASVSGSKGLFQARSLTCRTRDDDTWTIAFPDQPEFRKPFPPSGVENVKLEGLLSSGTSVVLRRGAPIWQEPIYLFWDTKQSRVALFPGGIWDAVEPRDWALRNLQLLSGFRLPGLKEVQPRDLQARTTRVEQFSCMTPDGTVTGVDALQLVLAEQIGVQGAVPIVPAPTSRAQMSMLFVQTHEDDRARLICDVLTPQILQPVKEYAQATMVDFTVDDAARRVEVEIELCPFGAKAVTWTFVYEATKHAE